MTLGDIIKEYRIFHKMSMDAFSEKTGLSKAYISLLEKNKHPKTGKPIAPSIQCIKQVAHGMNMDFDDLFKKIDGDVSLTKDISLLSNTKQINFNNDSQKISNSYKKTIDINSPECDIVQKYRFITKHSPEGKETIDYILNREYKVAEMIKNIPSFTSNLENTKEEELENEEEIPLSEALQNIPDAKEIQKLFMEQSKNSNVG